MLKSTASRHRSNTLNALFFADKKHPYLTTLCTTRRSNECSRMSGDIAAITCGKRGTAWSPQCPGELAGAKVPQREAADSVTEARDSTMTTIETTTATTTSEIIQTHITGISEAVITTGKQNPLLFSLESRLLGNLSG